MHCHGVHGPGVHHFGVHRCDCMDVCEKQVSSAYLDVFILMCSRGGHVSQGTLIGSKVYLFGGEDAARRPQADLFVLDLADKEWQTTQTTGA